MMKCLVLAAAALAATSANASIVSFTATGALSSGYGSFQAGDPFSFSVSYDDATPGMEYGDNVYAFDSSTTKVSFSIDGNSGTDDVLFYDIVDGQTLNIEQVGDDLGAQADLVFNLPSTFTNSAALPNQAQIDGSSGTVTFQFFPDPNAGPFDAGGVGTFGVGAVPEVSTWLMMILGFGAIGGVMRRLHRKSEERFTRKVRSLATA